MYKNKAGRSCAATTQLPPQVYPTVVPVSLSY